MGEKRTFEILSLLRSVLITLRSSDPDHPGKESVTRLADKYNIFIKHIQNSEVTVQNAKLKKARAKYLTSQASVVRIFSIQWYRSFTPYTGSIVKAAFLVGAQIGFIAFTAGSHPNPSSTIQRIIDIFSFCAVLLEALGALSALIAAQTLLKCHSTMDQFLQDRSYLEERMYEPLRRLQKYAEMRFGRGIGSAEMQQGGIYNMHDRKVTIVHGDVTNLTIEPPGRRIMIGSSQMQAEGKTIHGTHTEERDTLSNHMKGSHGKSAHVQQGEVRETAVGERGKDVSVQEWETGETSVREQEMETTVQGEEIEGIKARGRGVREVEGWIGGAETQELGTGSAEMGVPDYAEMQQRGIYNTQDRMVTVVHGNVTNLISGTEPLEGRIPTSSSQMQAEAEAIRTNGSQADGPETSSTLVRRPKGKSTHLQGGVRETDERGKDAPVQGPGTAETSMREKETGKPVHGEKTAATKVQEGRMGATVQEGGIGAGVGPVAETSKPLATMEVPVQRGNEALQLEGYIGDQDISDIRNLITQVSHASIELGVLDHDVKKHCAYNNTALLIIILGVICFFVALIGFIINSQPTVVWLPTLVVVSIAIFIVLRNENRHHTGRWGAVSSWWRKFVASHFLSRWASALIAKDLEAQEK